MKFFNEDSYLTIDFETPDAQWSLLVIDDRWDAVRNMVCGLKDPDTEDIYPGLEEKCVDYAAVKQYWDSGGVVVETFERALLFLPWMVHGTEGYGKITFCGFPNSTATVQELFLAPGEDDVDDVSRSQWAVMIDIIDQSDGEREKFTETWRLLDRVGHPAYARAKLTRGGVIVDPRFDEVEKITKEPPQGGDDGHRDRVRSWLLRVRGEVSGDRYQDLTARICHNPSDLKRATLEQRTRICDALADEDLYGVWRWCRKAVALTTLPEDATRRWLVGKAFQTWPGHSSHVPVTALIAICEGAKILCCASTQASFEVISDLPTVSDNEDNLLRLGQITLKSGDYKTFAPALRHWLTLVEQYEEGRAQIQEVKIVRPLTETGELRLEFTFSSKMPERVFTPEREDRKGRTTRAWEHLRNFASASEVGANPTVALLFDYSS
jgi:hypothetical protein